MKKLNFKTLSALSFVMLGLVSCSDDAVNEPDNNGSDPLASKEFQLAFASGSGSISGSYLQGVSDVTTGTISFENAGSLISTGRTSRIFPSADGKFVYSLTYTQGIVDKWEFNGGSNYRKLTSIDASIPLGATALRFYKLNEQEGSLHYIKEEKQFDANDNYIGHKMKLSLGILNLETMTLKPGFESAVTFEMPGDLKMAGYYISRIDCPVLSNGKLYFGAAVSKYNPATDRGVDTDKTLTLVVDYTNFNNISIAETTLAVGSTNGYRTPTQQVNESGEIYQLVNGANKTSIVKLVNGRYDATYKYSLDGLLGKPTSSNGFFYAGNGIAYIPYERKDLPQIQIGVNPEGEPSYSSAWGLARMDLINNTVVDLNVPNGLWLTQWQNSIVRNGKFYIALSPVGAAGHIYMFDVNSTSPDGVKGAATVSGADQYFIGIY